MQTQQANSTAVRASRSAATRPAMTRNGITMWLYQRPNEVVGLYLDHAGGWRLHTGADERGFRGYASQRFDLWQVHAWCPVTGFRFKRSGYKTEAGAVRALERAALRIEG